jgi:hypothetical protein
MIAPADVAPIVTSPNDRRKSLRFIMSWFKDGEVSEFKNT